MTDFDGGNRCALCALPHTSSILKYCAKSAAAMAAIVIGCGEASVVMAAECGAPENGSGSADDDDVNRVMLVLMMLVLMMMMMMTTTIKCKIL